MLGAALLSAVMACDGGSGVVGLEPGPGQRAGGAGTQPSGGVAIDQQLLGTWTRVTFLVGIDGFVYASENRWSFTADGRVTRQVIISNLSVGFAEEQFAVGDWSADGAVLTVNFRAPTQERFVTEYRVIPTIDGARLLLGQQSYQRVTL